MNLVARSIRRAASAGLPLPGVLSWKRNGSSDVCLTFDDGPFPHMTHRVLDLLKDHEARATFFVVGTQVEMCPKLTARIVSDGHVLGNHTYSHKPLTKIPMADAIEEIEKCQLLIERHGGSRLFRPPHGLLSMALLREVRRRKYRIAFWSMDSGDSEDVEGGLLGTKMIENDPAGQVILFHDDRRNGVVALERLLATGRDRGYRFSALT